MIVFAIRGHHPEAMVVLFRDPSDIWDREEIYLEETLTRYELAVLSRLIPESEWREL